MLKEWKSSKRSKGKIELNRDKDKRLRDKRLSKKNKMVNKMRRRRKKSNPQFKR